MKSALVSRVAVAAMACLSFNAMAQADPATPRVDQRQAHQERRIGQGVASGELTEREARRLQRQQGVIAKAEDHAKADGSVSRDERRRLHHMQDHASRAIYRQKHDAQRKAAAGS